MSNLIKTLFIFILLMNIGCSDELTDNPINSIQGFQPKSIEEFEREYITKFYDTISASPTSIKLIGFKTIPIEENQRKEFLEYLNIHEKELNQNNNHYFAADGSFVRIYFPMNEAIVLNNGVSYEADENGILDYGNDTRAVSKNANIVIIGRKKSEFVVGTGSNIITGNEILLRDPLNTKSRVKETENKQYVYVYDLGIREFHDDHGEESVNERSGYKVTCYANHRNRNCTTAFGYYGRCARQRVTCLDYNGWVTDCKKYSKTDWRRYRNFPGSDCAYAMGRGQCWNEL